MTDIHAVIAGLKALEAKEEYTLADQLDMCDALPRLLAYIERLEAVASAAKAHRESDPDSDGNSHARLGWELDSALDAMERDE